MNKCPEHLLKFDWYPPHQAWLAEQGLPHHEFPEGTVAKRADLSGADLSGVDLSGAYLRRTDLSGADLRRTDLSGAYLNGADLSGAYLRRTDLSGADLNGAKCIVSFGPVPSSSRIGYAVQHSDCVMVQLGCHWDTLENTLKILRETRTPGYVALVEAAALVLEETNG